jgi:membrane protein DedA with SNARE-associated domain
MTHFFTHNGLPVLFLAVMIESFGIPVPGETALIAFAVLAAEGHYSIYLVISLAAAGGLRSSVTRRHVGLCASRTIEVPARTVHRRRFWQTHEGGDAAVGESERL